MMVSSVAWRAGALLTDWGLHISVLCWSPQHCIHQKRSVHLKAASVKSEICSLLRPLSVSQRYAGAVKWALFAGGNWKALYNVASNIWCIWKGGETVTEERRWSWQLSSAETAQTFCLFSCGRASSSSAIKKASQLFFVLCVCVCLCPCTHTRLTD